MPEGLASCWEMVDDESKQTQVGLSCRLPRHTVRKAEVIMDRCILFLFMHTPLHWLQRQKPQSAWEQPLTSTLQAVHL